jgi:hypothetical protein
VHNGAAKIMKLQLISGFQKDQKVTTSKTNFGMARKIKKEISW